MSKTVLQKDSGTGYARPATCGLALLAFSVPRLGVGLKAVCPGLENKPIEHGVPATGERPLSAIE